jgi:hypothetical protein
MAKPRGSSKRKARSAVDFRALNPYFQKVDYPFPVGEEIIDDIPPGCKLFSTLDLAKAYHQTRVIDKEGCLTIRSRSGLYRFQVLPIVISTAVALFQKTIEQLLQEDLLVAGVRVYLDDILIFTRTEREHLVILEQVLHRLQTAGLKVRKEKCVFLQPTVTFLGYVISKDGVSLTRPYPSLNRRSCA